MGDDDRWMFLRTLGEMAKRTGIRVHAYALMDNHYHFESGEGGDDWARGGIRRLRMDKPAGIPEAAEQALRVDGNEQRVCGGESEGHAGRAAAIP